MSNGTCRRCGITIQANEAICKTCRRLERIAALEKELAVVNEIAQEQTNNLAATEDELETLEKELAGLRAVVTAAREYLEFKDPHIAIVGGKVIEHGATKGFCPMVTWFDKENEIRKALDALDRKEEKPDE